LKHEVIALLAFASMAFLLGNPSPATAVFAPSSLEISLVFSMVFTFAVGLEVIK